MATVEQSTSTAVERIPLERRISEIMDEKGDAFSIRAFSERIGINRETLRRMITGERRISPAELDQIAHGFGITKERLKQVDTEAKVTNLETLLKARKVTKTMLSHAKSIAEELVELALGVTERATSLINLGRVQYLEKQYDNAHKTWLHAYDLAKTIQNQHNDKHILHQVTTHLMLTYAIRKEYAHIEELLDVVEKVFADDPEALGKAFFTRMKMQYDRGNLEMAKKHAYRSLEHFEKSNDNRQIGHALINVAHFEYLLGDYKTASRALSAALKMVEKFEDIFVVVVKDYVKTLLKLHENERAISLIEKYEPIAKEYLDYWAKMQIMYTVLKDDPSYAERVSEDSKMDSTIRFLACKCLFEFYEKKGESDTALKYYRKGRIYSSNKSDFYDTEGF